MTATKKPEHIQPRVGPKQEPPKTSWWTDCDRAEFKKRQSKAQERMSGGSETVYAKANGEDES